jgi:hypothetical protein
MNDEYNANQSPTSFRRQHVFSLICGKNVAGHGLIPSDALLFPGFRTPKDA